MPRFLFDIDESSYGVDEMLDKRNERTFKMPDAVIDGVLLEGGRMMIVGPSKIGKTQEALYLALMLATGGEWRGHRCKRSNVLFISVEVELSQIRERLRFMIDWFDLDPSTMGNIKVKSLVGVVIEDVSVDDLYDEVMTDTERDRQIDQADRMRGQRPMIEAIVDSVNCSKPFDDERGNCYGPDVLIIDPLQKVLGCPENDAQGVNRALLAMDGLRSWRPGGYEPPITCVYTHHTPKGNGDSENVFDAGRGSSALGADAAAVVQMVRLRVRPGTPEHDEMVRAGVSNPTECIEMRFGFRAFPSVPPLRLMATRPIALPMESDSPLQGSHTLAARGGEARAARAAEDRERRARATRAAMEACEADGVRPTGRNVMERIAGPCEAEGIDPPTSERSARRWVKECQNPSL